jgi:uncharacterized protein (DUF1800 family)
MVATPYPRTRSWVTLAKLSYGFTPEELSLVKKNGTTNWLDQQLDPNFAEGTNCTSKLAGFKSLSASIAEVSNFAAFAKNNDLAGDELAATTLIRNLFSSRQLFEMLVEHFNDYIHVPLHSAWQSRMSYDRDVIRTNALRSYPEMLRASSLHPAMLDYLNGNQNTKGDPNENYGRELQELHTITSQSGYTQSDVVNAARVFSGIYWDDEKNILAADPDQHWIGQVTVFGWSNTNSSSDPIDILRNSQSLVQYLAMRPETAKAFSTRMARRFIADDPPATLVKSMARKYLATGGNIPSVVKTMVNSREFLASAGIKVKRPLEHLASLVRFLDLKLAKNIQPGDLDRPDDYFHDSVMADVVYYLRQQGHEPLAWPFPNGYPDRANTWTTLNGQLHRWNNGAALTHGWNDQVFLHPEYEKLLAGTPPDPGTVLDALSLRLLGSKLSVADRADILSLVANSYDSGSSLSKINQYGQMAAALLIASPNWNFR